MAAGMAVDTFLVDALSITLRVTAIVLAAGVLSIFVRRSSAAVRHLIWAMAMAGILALPLFTLVLPEIAVPMPRALAAVSGIAPAGILRVGASPISEMAEAGAARDGVVPDHAVGARWSQFGVAAGSEKVAAEVRSASVPILVLCVWVSGALLVLALAGEEQRRLRAIRRRARPVGERTAALLDRLAAESGVRGTVRALAGPAAEVPATWGVFRPFLLLPEVYERWSHSCLTSVLRHELAHIRRHDYLVQLCGQLACAIYWFHPLMWVAASRLRIESEHACDDAVVESGMRPEDYARELVGLAAVYSSRGMHRAVPAVVGRSLLRRRVLAMLDADRARSAPRRGVMLLASLAAALVVGVAAAASSAPREPQEAAPIDTVRIPPGSPAAVAWPSWSQGFHRLTQFAGTPAGVQFRSAEFKVLSGPFPSARHYDFEAFPLLPQLVTIPDETVFEWGGVTLVPGPPPGNQLYDFDAESELFRKFLLEAIHPAVTGIGRLDEESAAHLARRVAYRLWRTLAITVWVPKDAGQGPTIGVTGNSILDVNRISSGPLRIDLRALDGPFNQVLPRLVLRELSGAVLDLSSAEESALSEQLARAGDLLSAAWTDHLSRSRQP